MITSINLHPLILFATHASIVLGTLFKALISFDFINFPTLY